MDIFDGVGGFTYTTTLDQPEIWTEDIRGWLAEGTPVMVCWNDWGGHWQVIVGYDTMGTESEQDDVILVADPYDTTDHNQDCLLYTSERRYYRQAQVVNQNPKKKKKYVRKPDRDPGRGFTIGGAIMAGIFALGAADEFFSALSRGGLLASLGDIFTPLAFCGVGLFLMYLGVTKSKKAKRYRKYMALILSLIHIWAFSMA